MKKVMKDLLKNILPGMIARKHLILANGSNSSYFSTRMIKNATLLFAFVLSGMFTESNGQILKKLGKKIEQQAERRAENKVDKAINKSFDKVEEGVDNSMKEGSGKETKSSGQNAVNKSSGSVKGEMADINFLNDDEPYSLEEAKMVNMKDGLVMVSGNCDEYIWFNPGATMSFKTISGIGKKQEVSNSKMVVKKVYNENGKKISEVNITAEEGVDMDFKYLCSGKNLYVDMGAAMKQAMKKAGQDNPQSNALLNDMEMGFGDGFMDIPKNMYPGQLLKDINFSMKSKASGTEMTMITNLTERKVGAKEKVTTPAGTFDCMPITGIRKSSMKIMGMNRNLGKPTKETIWYSPGIGMVKSENYDAKGNLESSQVLTAFNR